MGRTRQTRRAPGTPTGVRSPAAGRTELPETRRPKGTGARSPRAAATRPAAQTEGAAYSVAVGPAVKDLLGSSVAPGASTADFAGYAVAALVRVDGVNAIITDGCDLVELRVVQGGSLDGQALLQRLQTLVVFEGVKVQTDDLIVVHLDGTDPICNPTGAYDETLAPDELPAWLNPQNFDGAYDWYATVDGVIATDNVLTVFRADGTIADAVLLSDGPDGTAAADSQTAAAKAAEAFEWLPVSGPIPAGGYLDDAFNANAVQGLKGTSKTPVGLSIQRLSDAGTNTAADWGLAESTWGAENPGQSF